jgi:hypothetical protein
MIGVVRQKTEAGHWFWVFEDFSDNDLSPYNES